jgi:hypothetical protein
VLQHQPPVHLPDGVDQHRPTIGQIVVTVGLALGPVAQVVGADHPERAAHAHRGPDPDKPVLQPQRTLEAAVDHAPVKADGMAEQQGRPGRQDEDGNGCGADRQRPGDQGHDQHRSVPQRMNRVPDHAPGDGITSRRLDQAVDGARVKRVVHWQSLRYLRNTLNHFEQPLASGSQIT